MFAFRAGGRSFYAYAPAALRILDSLRVRPARR
jgi:hypothetical protein